MYTHPPRMNLPLLRFIWLAHRLIHATVIIFFVFAVRLSLAHFYPSRQSALRVPGFVCAQRWKTASSGARGTMEVHAANIYIKYVYRNILRIRPAAFSHLRKQPSTIYSEKPVSLRKRMETNPHNEIIINPNFVFVSVVRGWFHQWYRLTFVI